MRFKTNKWGHFNVIYLTFTLYDHPNSIIIHVTFLAWDAYHQRHTLFLEMYACKYLVKEEDLLDSLSSFKPSLEKLD